MAWPFTPITERDRTEVVEWSFCIISERRWAWDSWLLAHPWGFRVEEIAVPTYVWQGEQDRLVPPADGHYLAQAIPNCRAVFFPEEGHLLSPPCWDEIFSTLVGERNAC